MSVQEIESAVSTLPPNDMAEFVRWFEDFRARERKRQAEEDQRWDEQIAADGRSGRLDALIRQAQEEVKAGQACHNG
jgi:hypothetical protein